MPPLVQTLTITGNIALVTVNRTMFTLSGGNVDQKKTVSTVSVNIMKKIYKIFQPTLLSSSEIALCILMLKKRRPPWALYKVCLICIVIRGSLTGQRYVDEVLRPHVLQIYQTVGNNFLFQQDKASIPAIWQGYPFLGATFLEFEHRLVEQWQCIPQGEGYNPRLLLSMRKSLIECIHKGGGHTKYDLQYTNL